MAEQRCSGVHWLLLAGSLVFVSLACGEFTAKENEADTPRDTKSENVEVAKKPGIGSKKVRKSDDMEMVYVPAGDFLMGTADSYLGEADEDELLQHKVYLDAYWIDKTEVTNAMFAQFVADTDYLTDAEVEGWGFGYDGESWGKINLADWQHPQGSDSDIDGMDDYPVVQVSWNDAAAYCEWVGKRLPSEAEWEKAARGTDGRVYSWGNEAPSGELLNYADSNLKSDWSDISEDDGYKYTAPVGSYEAGASPYEALDMMGNVCEWVNDWFDKAYYAQSPADNPQGAARSGQHGIRGGSWFAPARVIRCTNRGAALPSNRLDDLGFRCALTAAPQGE